MALRHILLGLLQKPASGYDLKKAFNQSLAHFWAAELSQIYPLLGRLEKEGLLESELSASDKGPARRVYRRTERGARMLQAWLAEGPEFGGNRVPYLAKVYFLDQVNDDARALDFFRQLLKKMQAELQVLTSVEQSWRQEDPRYPDALPDSEFYMQVTLVGGIQTWRARIAWCEQCIERLKVRSAAERARQEKTA